MKLLLVADEESKYIWDHFDKDRFNDIDATISCGDLNPKYLSFLVTMINAPLFYVHGNHDRNYDITSPLGCDNIDGKFIIFKGIRILGLGGSINYSQKSHQYTEQEMCKRIKKLKKVIKRHGGFDILVTHSPAFKLGDGEDNAHIGFKCFIDLLDTYSPKFLFHGHQHLNYGHTKQRIIVYKNTTIINATGYHIVEF